MKKIAFLLAALLLLTSCGVTGNEPDDAVDASDAFHAYPLENTSRFTVSSDGTIYAVEEMTTIIKAYDFEGTETAVYELELRGSILHMCADGDVVYFTAMTTSGITEVLHSYDTATQTLTELVILSDFTKIKKIEVLEGVVYILGVDLNYINAEYDVWEGSFRYSYDGTVLSSYNLASGAFEMIHDDLTDNFSITPDGTVMIYAYDSEGGFFFSELDLKDKTMGDKAYRNIGQMTSFAHDGKGVVFFSSGGSKTSFLFTLYYTLLDEDKGVADIMPNVNVVWPDDIAFKDGYTYYLNHLSRKIERIKNEVYVKLNEKIKFISSTNMLTDIFTAGFGVEYIDLTYDEFALTVLSRDKMYDVCYISSRQDFASNIRDKGSFYPLNDVPGVMEFFDACFPFIKDAATNKDGDIWMIPIDVSVAAMIYHEQNSIDAGISFDDAATVDDIISIADKARELDPFDSIYSFNGYPLIQRSVIKYLRDNETLNTPEFRRLAESLKDVYTSGLIRGHNNAIEPYNFADSNNGFLFTCDSSRITQALPFYIGRDELRAISATGTEGPYSADCVFLCVNPDSENLQSTLEYITAVCRYMTTLTNTYMFTDTSRYTDSDYARSLYELYENSVIDFNISDEVFTDVFDRYLRGELELDAMIDEADRKLAMYRGE